ncbi:uncharacterized protein LOC127785925 [Oryza glaberrima]|uniref:uncharacterized protein LOC127785925 n=1 Tax=Oryza glaberrima TaxID=4538 RepID=UPI00224C14C3|nr:uncharacterized protein LOC127785925 [Oryza glaberrima]
MRRWSSPGRSTAETGLSRAAGGQWRSGWRQQLWRSSLGRVRRRRPHGGVEETELTRAAMARGIPTEATAALRRRSSPSYKGGTMCTQYTAVVWKNTTGGGGGRVVCTSGDTIMVCSYWPPGNYVGVKLY